MRFNPVRWSRPSSCPLLFAGVVVLGACSSEPSSDGVTLGGRSSVGGSSSGGSTNPTTGGSNPGAGGVGGSVSGGSNTLGGAPASGGSSQAGSSAAGAMTTGGTGAGGGTGTGGTATGGVSGQSGGAPSAGAGTGGVPLGGSGGGGGQDMTDVTTYFAGLRCGAHYTAFGDGGWTFCLRLEDGSGACTMASGSEVFQRATFQGGGAINSVAQIAGINDNGALVVTAAGALHYGSSFTAISTTPLIASGVVNVTAGRNARAALVREGTGFKVMGWTGDGTPAAIALPSGVRPMQVSANYDVSCALDDTGSVYCWEAGSNHDLGITKTPSKMAFDKPLKMISAGQNAVCGVSFGNTLECVAGWYSSPWLPTEGMAPNFKVRQSTFPVVRSVHAGFHYGIVVRGDGQAFHLGNASPGMDNPGTAFTGAVDVVAGGGDRGNACVLTSAGSVYCRAGTTVKQATIGGSPLKAVAATCTP